MFSADFPSKITQVEAVQLRFVPKANDAHGAFGHGHSSPCGAMDFTTISRVILSDYHSVLRPLKTNRLPSWPWRIANVQIAVSYCPYKHIRKQLWMQDQSGNANEKIIIHLNIPVHRVPLLITNFFQIWIVFAQNTTWDIIFAKGVFRPISDKIDESGEKNGTEITQTMNEQKK